MNHFLRVQNKEDEQHIDLAIETIGQADDEALTQQLIDYLMGDTDGMPKVCILPLERLSWSVPGASRKNKGTQYSIQLEMRSSITIIRIYIE